MADRLWEHLALRTPTLPPATTTNSVIVGTHRFLVIDPGTPWPQPQEELETAITRRIEAGQQLAGVALTHHHRDHCGGVEALTRFARERALEPLAVLAHGDTLVEVPRWLGTATRSLEDGEEIVLGEIKLDVVHTPGHTRGHLCFLAEDRSVGFVGDMVASEGTIVIDPSEGDMADYLDSLSLLRDRNLEILVPAHGEPVSDPRALLGHYIEHRLQRERLVVGALGPQLQSLEQLLPGAYPDVATTLYPLASRSLLAHLLKLKAEGRARCQEEQWGLVVGS